MALFVGSSQSARSTLTRELLANSEMLLATRIPAGETFIVSTDEVLVIPGALRIDGTLQFEGDGFLYLI